MNKKILSFSILMSLIIALGFSYTFSPPVPSSMSRKDVYKNKLIASCSPDWSLLNTDSLAAGIKPLPGWGSYTWKINSSADSAQYYFDQGINMYYAFHIIEAMASFKKAALFDSNNPHIYWAQALAYGPNINDFAYAPSTEALAMAVKAKELSTGVSQKDKALIDAMQVRYTADTTFSRTALNTAYAAAMKLAYEKFGNDADVIALYADALMLLHPWEYWKHNGEPHPWTPELLEVIEKGLKIDSLHPGLNHYYIHATEASPNPGRALPSADRLGILMPEVSHMVHMPSHIYIRTGNYQKGIRVNEMSVDGYNNYKKIFPEVEKNAGLYLIHNLHMQAACAMFRPNYAYAIKSANECMSSFDTSFMSLPQPMGNYIQYVYMTPQLMNVRYGKWDRILKDKSKVISPDHAYATVLNLWALGMAYANTGNISSAWKFLQGVRYGMTLPDMKVVMEPFNAPMDAAIVAERILQGTIYEKLDMPKMAIDAYKEAVKFEDDLIYNEPRDWMIPSRHYLANAQIIAKQFAEAEKTLAEDLKQNPDNFYALYAMELVLTKQGKKQEAEEYMKRFKIAFKQPDVLKAALVY